MNTFLRRNLAVAVAALGVSSFAMLPATAQDFSGPEFEAAIKAYIESNPEVILDSVNAFVARQQAEQAAQQDTQFLDVADQLINVENAPVIGNPDGDITMLYVLDAACTYCRKSTPVVQELVEKNPDLKVVQLWVPFLTPASNYAGRVATLVHERYPDKYAEFYHELMMKTAGLTNEMVDDVVATVLGGDVLALVREDMAGAVEGPRLASEVQRNLELTHVASIEGTPLFYVDGAGSEGIFRGAVPAQVVQVAIEKVRADK